VPISLHHLFFSRTFIRGLISALYWPLVERVSSIFKCSVPMSYYVVRKTWNCKLVLVFYKDGKADLNDYSVLCCSVFTLCRVLEENQGEDTSFYDTGRVVGWFPIWLASATYCSSVYVVNFVNFVVWICVFRSNSECMSWCWIRKQQTDSSSIASVFLGWNVVTDKREYISSFTPLFGF